MTSMVSSVIDWFPRKRSRVRDQPKSSIAELSSLPNDVLTSILLLLNFRDVASVQCVNRKLYSFLKWPKSSHRVYGSLTFTVDSTRPGFMPPPELARYLLTRLPGFEAAKFRSEKSREEYDEEDEWEATLEFFRVGLPQLAPIFEKHGVDLEIEVQQGGHIFMCEPVHLNQEQDEGKVDRHFRADYWQLLAPALKSLTLTVTDLLRHIPRQRTEWLLLMRNLQLLDIQGEETLGTPHITFPEQLRLPALKELSLMHLSLDQPFQLDCPSLEVFRFKSVRMGHNVHVPSGLQACTRLSTLDFCATGDPDGPHLSPAEIFGAVEGVRDSLEELDVSGCEAEELPEWLRTLPRFHTLRAAHNRLRALPSLPSSMRVLDLRGNCLRDIPTELEAMTSLTSLRLCPPINSALLQISRDLGPIIRLPNLRLLQLVSDTYVLPEVPGYDVWNARSLAFLGLAQFEISQKKLQLELRF